MSRIVVLVMLLSTCAVAGCGSGGDDAGSTTTAAKASVTTERPTPTNAPTTTAAPPAQKDGTALAQGLQASIPSITKIVTLNEDNDPNNKIGRPNGYISGAVIYDAGVECTDLGVDCGATVEVWPSAADAKARSEYIQGLQKDAPMLGSEYNYFNGAALLRVSGDIKPSVAATYQAAFEGS